MEARQIPPSLGFFRQEHWSGLPFPSPMHESKKWKWICSVVSDSVWPHRQQPTRLPRPWDSPGKNTGVGCHFLLQCMKVKSESEVAQLCRTLRDPMDCTLPGSSVHGIFQARALEWVAIAFSLLRLRYGQLHPPTPLKARTHTHTHKLLSSHTSRIQIFDPLGSYQC